MAKHSELKSLEPTASEESSLVSAHLYSPNTPPCEVDITKLHELERSKESTLWIGLKDPSEAMVKQVCTGLGIADHIQKEILVTHRRPKLIEYSEVGYFVVITVDLKRARPIFGETQIIVGEGFLLTIRRGSSSHYKELRSRLEASPELILRGSDYIASELLDLIVDNYSHALMQLEVAVEQLEQKFLLHGFNEPEVRTIYRLRRDLLRIETVISPLAEISRRIARVGLPFVEDDSRAYFAEVSDRVLRSSEFIRSLRESLAFAFEGGLMIGQMEQTDTTRKLAAWAAILAVPTAVAGIYGMNFKLMPELDLTFGYPAVLAFMAAVCGTLYWKFKKAKWL